MFPTISPSLSWELTSSITLYAYENTKREKHEHSVTIDVGKKRVYVLLSEMSSFFAAVAQSKTFEPEHDFDFKMIHFAGDSPGSLSN